MFDFEFNEIFDPHVSEYRVENAYCLAQASRLAYEDHRDIEKTVKGHWGFNKFEFFDRRETQAFLAADDDKIIVVFRGTEPTNLADWFSDLDIDLVDGPVGKLHHGFSRAYSFVAQDIEDAIAELRRVNVVDVAGLKDRKRAGPGSMQSLWFAGHSLGGALATVAVVDFKLRQDKPVRGVYTFGQPRVGDGDLARAFNAVFKQHAFRFVNNNDVVTRVPPRGKGYSHMGSVRYIDVNGKVRDDLSHWDRFLDRISGRLEDFQDVMRGNLMPDGIEDHSLDTGYIPSLEKALP